MRYNTTNAGMLGAPDAYALMNSTQGLTGDPIEVDDVKKEFYVALATGLAGLLFSVLTGLYSCFIDRKLKECEARLEVQKQRLTRIEDVKELMKQYKKPLVSSAFDLLSRLAQECTGGLLQRFGAQKGRREKYAKLSTVYLIAEFLGWLEVVHQEIVFVTGEKAATLNEILDAIKFQFSGETFIQGVTDTRAPTLPDADEQSWSIFQLFGVELRAIGEVMLDVRSYDDNGDLSTGLSVIGYAEFTRRYTKQPPKPKDFGLSKSKAGGGRDDEGEGSEVSGAEEDDAAEAKAKYGEALERWHDSKEKLLQDTVRPLTKSVKKLMEASATTGAENKPHERLVMLQVLLCKLIDFLDDGEKGDDDNAMVEERYLARNDRITPLVSRLGPEALLWLATRPFMEDCTPMVDPLYRDKWLEMVDREGKTEDGIPYEAYKRVAFPGFREDRHPAWNELISRRRNQASRRSTAYDTTAQGLQQELLFSNAAGTFFPGAFPPKVRRSTLRHPYYWIPAQLRRIRNNLYNACYRAVTGVPPTAPEDPLSKLVYGGPPAASVPPAPAAAAAAAACGVFGASSPPSAPSRGPPPPATVSQPPAAVASIISSGGSKAGGSPMATDVVVEVNAVVPPSVMAAARDGHGAAAGAQRLPLPQGPSSSSPAAARETAAGTDGRCDDAQLTQRLLD